MKKTKSKYLKIKRSGIHNKGGFAKIDIPKNQEIIEYVGEKIPKKESEKRCDQTLENAKRNSKNGLVYMFELNKKYDIDGNVKWNTARWINHSCNPNAEAQIEGGKRIIIVSKRPIKKGEEITYDYGYDIDCYEDHPCKCGSKNCVGYIVQRKQWKKLKKVLEEKEKSKIKKE